MNSTGKTVVIYHDHCADGAAAAWVAQRALRDPECHAMSYGDELPPIEDGSQLYVLDFSLDRHTMVALNERLGSDNVELLDHHESAAHRLAGLPNCYFDPNRSGAMIAWDYFFSGQPPPEIIRYVQDRDLWRWNLPNSREVNAWIASWADDDSFARWNDMAQMVEEQRETVIAQGRAILRTQDALVRQAAGSAIISTIDGHDVPVVTSPVLASEIGERLLELYPSAPFAAVRALQDGGDRYSLRSRQGGHNVAETATRLGGGGHPSAAGFRVRPPAPEPEDETPEEWATGHAADPVATGRWGSGGTHGAN